MSSTPTGTIQIFLKTTHIEADTKWRRAKTKQFPSVRLDPWILEWRMFQKESQASTGEADEWMFAALLLSASRRRPRVTGLKRSRAGPLKIE